MCNCGCADEKAKKPKKEKQPKPADKPADPKK